MNSKPRELACKKSTMSWMWCDEHIIVVDCWGEGYDIHQKMHSILLHIGNCFSARPRTCLVRLSHRFQKDIVRGLFDESYKQDLT